MSTYCYFECLDHDPPLRSVDEFTQHVGDRYWDHAMELIDSRPLEEDNSYWAMTLDEAHATDAYFNMRARAFLSKHEACRIGIVTEYGERLDRAGRSCGE